LSTPTPIVRVALRVEVHQQHAALGGRERGGEVDRGGGFADATFLVGDRDYMRHSAIPVFTRTAGDVGNADSCSCGPFWLATAMTWVMEFGL
jgi:hypothetical protein